jgi:hypothetical protein
MTLDRNQWYEITPNESGAVFARWRDATADGPEVFVYEQSYSNEMPTNGEIFLVEEYADENLAISRLELAITGGS